MSSCRFSSSGRRGSSFAIIRDWVIAIDCKDKSGTNSLWLREIKHKVIGFFAGVTAIWSALHPDKTRLIEFGRYAAQNRKRRGLGKPETFKFLGFVLICGKSRRGGFLVKRKSRRDRMRARLQAIKEELRQRMHQPIPATGKWLTQVVSGFFAYHAVPTNGAAIGAFRYHVTILWHRSLRRRSQRARLGWERMKKLADGFLPRPRILHPWPSDRFAVKHPRWEPSARIGLARIYAGGAQK